MTESSRSNVYVLAGDGTSALSDCPPETGFSLHFFSSLDALYKAFEQTVPEAILIDCDLPGELYLRDKILAQSLIVGWSENNTIEIRLRAARIGCSHFIEAGSGCQGLQRLDEILKNYLGQVNQPAYRVLMVDDDISTLEMHSLLLETQDIQVKKLLNPLDALAALDTFDPDLILLDLSMPQCSGLELAQVIRMEERFAYIPIVFLSAETDLKQQNTAMLSGGDDFVVKPVDPFHFISLVQARLKRARYIKELNRKLKLSLYESEQQSVTLGHHAIVSVANVLGEIISVNDKFCEISGYNRDELIGHNHRMLKSALHPDSFYEEMWDTISNGNVWHGTLCNLTKSGKEYWVESTIVPFLGEDGLPYQYVSARTDVTKVRENEERLSRSQKFANIGTWDWNIRTGELYWSERIATLFGYNKTIPETTYDNFLAAVHPDDREKVVAAVSDCVEHGKHYDIEHRVIWDDGTEHWLHESGDVILDTSGKPIHMLGVVRDITQRKDTELKLAASEQHNRMMLNSMGEGMFGLDQEGHFTFINQSACDLLGYHASELIAQPVSSLFPEVNASAGEGEVTAILNTLNTALSYQASNVLFAKKHGRKLPVEYYSTPIINEGSVIGAVVTFKDISERLQYEAELIKAKEEAERANRAKSQFLSSMSHELRTPLNAIIGFGQLMQMAPDQPLTFMQKDNIQEILKAGNHLLDLINEILDLAKIEAGQVPVHIEMVSVTEILEDSIALVGSMAEKNNISILFNYQGREVTLSEIMQFHCSVMADKLRLKQVMLNLLSNAIKYNKSGGTVTINCQSTDEGSLRLGIEDSGIGLTPEQQKELFQPFNRLGAENSSVEGTGMGLVISKSLIEFMGGRLEFESTAGKGSLFVIDLVLASESPETETETESRQKPEQDETENKIETDIEASAAFNVLYIEDNPANIRLMAQIMSGLDYINLWTVHEPLLGLDIVRENNPDLVLLDINLPGMSGVEVLKKIREEIGDALPVIAVSANAMQNDIKAGLNAGFDAYITKPIRIAELITAVNQALQYNP